MAANIRRIRTPLSSATRWAIGKATLWWWTSVGFNDETWLDQVGHPHSDVLHVVERYTRTDSNTLRYEALIDDPKTYSKSWSTSWNIPFQPGWELNEYICQENNKDLSHMVGK